MANSDSDTRTDFQKILVELTAKITAERIALDKWSSIKDSFVDAVDALVVSGLLATYKYPDAIKETLERWAAKEAKNVATLSNLVRILREQKLNSLADNISETWPDLLTNSKAVLDLVGQSSVQIHTQTLNGILSKVGDRPLAIYSINGKKRGGKSFMLNQFLKYLQFSRTHPNDWIEQLLPKTFIWRGGEEKVTSGVQIWSDVYHVEHGGREIAVVLLDAQGLYDEETEMNGNALVFAYSTLLSSVNIFNTKDVAEDTLQFLHTFIEYAKLGVRDDDGAITEGQAAFQKLILLIRDYPNDREFGFGLHDGQTCPMNANSKRENLKEHFFDNLDDQTRTRMSAQVKLRRRDIRACFQDLGVAALPSPGASLERRDNESPSSWDPEFKQHVIEFVEGLFSPTSVQAHMKQVGREEMTGNKLMDFVGAWADLYTNPNNLPDFKSVLEATADIQGKQNVQKALKSYRDGIDQLIRSNPKGVASETLVSHHETLSASSLAMLRAARGIGGRTFEESFVDLLKTEIRQVHAHYVELNANNIAAAARLAEEERQRVAAELLAAQQRAAAIAARRHAVDMAQRHVEDARRALDEARARRTAVDQNRDAYHDIQTVRTKHRRRVAGIVVSPYYTESAVKVFNQGRFDQAVAAAEQEIRNEEERVRAAESALQEANNELQPYL